MKTFSPLTLVLSLTTLISATPVKHNHFKRGLPDKKGYRATFVDDFTGVAGSFPSEERWQIMTGTKYPGGPERWGTDEYQTYARDTANVVITSDGTLSLKATLNDDWVWRSGRIESIRGGFAAEPEGKMLIETRLRLGNAPEESAQGIWPAVWALGDWFRGHYVDWPQVTEWDIMESFNGESILHTTVHCGTAPGGVCNETDGLANPGGVHMSRGEFHTIGFLIDRTMVGPGKPGTWRDERITWTLDFAKIYSITGATVNDEGVWDVLAHKGHYLLLNVAVGGYVSSLSFLLLRDIC